MGMTINPRGRGFEVYVRATGPGGNSRRIRRTLPTHEEAEAFGLAAKTAILAGRPVPASTEAVRSTPRTLEEASLYTLRERWEKTCKDAKGIKNQWKNASQWLDLFGPETPLTAVTTDEIERVKHDRGDLSYKTGNRKLTTLSVILRTAHRMGWLAAMPHIPMTPEDPRKDRRLRYADKDEVNEMAGRMREMGNPALADFVEVLNGTGMRTGELLGLKETKVVGDKIELEVFKGGNERTLSMTPRVQEILDARRGRRTGLLFPDVSQTNLNRVWNRVKVDMGLGDDREFTPHSIRHGVATRLARANVHKSQIATWLGHRNEATTDIYIKVAGTDLEDVADLLA